MGHLLKVFLICLLVVVYIGLTNFGKTPPMPELEENPWWGPGKTGKDDSTIKPFKINIPEDAIKDLKTRLSSELRLTPPLKDANFTYGFNSDTLKTITAYWKNKYNWKEREARLNNYPHFKTQIEGLDIHFMRAKPSSNLGSRKVHVKPLLLLHGWPGSFVEFERLIPLLTTPQEGSDVVFDVICPSIPGYGFSEASSKQGLGALQTAQIYLKLMKRLGLNEFYVQGGDWGAMISSHMATMYPKNVIGMHINMIMVNTGLTTIKYLLGAFLPSGLMFDKADEENMYPISTTLSFILRETGYLHIQVTKPDTIGIALNDSPAGLMAYILEKFSSGMNLANLQKPDGGLLSKDISISLDRLLDNISLYWFTKSITSSMRFYAESFGSVVKMRLDQIPTDVPAGFSAFRQETINRPRSFAAHKFTNIISYRKHEVGGHFAAMEQPNLLATDVHDFVTEVQKTMSKKGKKLEM